MARPLSVSDDQILDAAQRVLERRGPDGFTASEVAREVKLTRTAVALRFISTEALKALVIERQLTLFREQLAKLKIEKGAKGLLAIADFIASRISGRDRLANFLLRLTPDGDDAHRRAMEIERGRMLRTAIDKAMPLTVIDREAAGNAFMAHVTGTLVAWQFVDGIDARNFMRQRTLDWVALLGIKDDR